LHPGITALKREIDDSGRKTYDVDLTYLTSRGYWYFTSCKGDVAKSGGVATNIGIHFFDMLIWIFGEVKKNIVHLHTHDRAAGFLELEKANVKWFLSVDHNTIPGEVRKAGQRIYRSIRVNGKKIEFCDGFGDLHTASYRHILDGKGFGLKDAKQSIQIVHEIRNAKPDSIKGEYHPLAKLPLTKHPFNVDL